MYYYIHYLKHSTMKKLFSLSAVLFVVAFLCGSVAQAQNAPASPAQTAKGKLGNADVTISYSSPAVKGRTLWGQLVPYGKVWRAGANDATTFETTSAVQVEGKTLPAGKYALFAIPQEDQWTIVFNKVSKQWGAFNYDEGQDALRVTAKPRKAASFNERLTYNVGKDGFTMAWGDLEVPVAVK